MQELGVGVCEDIAVEEEAIIEDDKGADVEDAVLAGTKMVETGMEETLELDSGALEICDEIMELEMGVEEATFEDEIIELEMNVEEAPFENEAEDEVGMTEEEWLEEMATETRLLEDAEEEDQIVELLLIAPATLLEDWTTTVEKEDD